MAGLASGDCTIGSRLLHTLFELSFVRITVATAATQILPVINDRRLRPELRGLLVTISTRDRDVPTRQYEVRLFVLSQTKRGRLVSLERMAAVAGVEVGRRHKLPRMIVGMAVGAAFEFDLEHCVIPSRDVTFRTFHHRMFALQRICARRVLLHGESRRLPSLHRMAGSALSALLMLGELATVRIGFVAIHALLKWQRLSEVSVGVALGAIDADMFPFQRELGL